MRALALVLVTCAVALVVRPAGPAALPPSAGQPQLWHGAYHVHSTRSDGSGSPEQIAGAAADAGLEFVILTDHGDGTRAPAPPRYIDGVLLIDGVEISTDDGHYVALGMAQAPYPLAGEGRAVAEDVQRLGGIGIVAHPDSPRAALAWHDPSAPADGFEWINADSVWRGASTGQLLARLVTYPLNRSGSLAALASYPEPLFAFRDTPRHAGRLALAAVDAHARIGWRRAADPMEGGAILARFPSYRAMFGTFGLLVPWINDGPSGTAAKDADAVLQAIRHGLAYSGVFSMADRPWLSFGFAQRDDDGTRRSLPHPTGPGAASRIPVREARGGATLSVRSNLPAGATIRVRRNGRAWQETDAPSGTFDLAGDASPGVYRAETWLPRRRGWPALPVAVSQSVAHNLVGPGGSKRVPSREDRPMAVAGWHVEHDPRSSAALVASGDSAIATATVALAGGARVSQFAALVADVGQPPAGATGISLRLRADEPMRLSVQWREPRHGEGLRWRHSAFVGPGGNSAWLPLNEFRPIPPATGTVPLERVHALLLVMDTVNARPGDRRTVTVYEARWTFAR